MHHSFATRYAIHEFGVSAHKLCKYDDEFLNKLLLFLQVQNKNETNILRRCGVCKIMGK